MCCQETQKLILQGNQLAALDELEKQIDFQYNQALSQAQEDLKTLHQAVIEQQRTIDRYKNLIARAMRDASTQSES